MLITSFFYKGSQNIKENLPLSLNRLLRGCFLQQESSGIFRMLPLGLKVLKKIVTIIEEEMNKISIQIELPMIQSVDLWKKSGRYDVYGKEMLRLKDRNDNEFIIPPTCEEAIFDVFNSLCISYKDLPKSLYQITWKFRDEIRPRGGLFRGRLFLMKDSYSFASNEKDAHKQYIDHFNVYVNIFKKLNMEVYVVKADSGEIGGDLSHEFVVENEEGDGISYIQRKLIKNIETLNEIQDICGIFDEKLKEPNKDYISIKAMEIGHIFYYDQKYSKKLSTKFTNKEGKPDYYYGGCYGIGVTRIMGILSMKKFWPISVSPFHVHMICINGKEDYSMSVYKEIKKHNIDILYDDRENISFGSKRYDQELIGIPIRIIIGKEIELYYLEEDKQEYNDIKELIEKIKDYIK